jgi:D-inositol-3-phosphate glycosyltransferase
MKILFVLENYFPFIGGAEVLFKNLCEGLAARGHEVVVVTSRLPGTSPTEMLNNVKIVRVKTPGRASRYWFTFLAIPLAIRMSGWADIVHTTTYNAAFPAWLAARLRRKKCLITVLEIIGPMWKDMIGMNPVMAWLHRSLEGMVVSLPFARYVAISRYTADCLRKHGADTSRIQVIYPGIDYTVFDPSKASRGAAREKLNISDRFLCLYYGRPGMSKGAEYLVAAVPLIIEKVKNSRLIMLLAHEPAAGYGRIRALIDRMGLGGYVRLFDPVSREDLPSYLAAADCVVVPSLSEGFGFSAAEACAMGVPVVASNVASLPEVVSGSYVLVEPRNARAIALGVEAVYNNMTLRTDRKVFLWSDCIDQYEELMAGLPAKRKEMDGEL